MNDKCPSCESPNIVTGRYLDQIGGGLLPVFRPTGLRPLTLTGTDVWIPSGDRFVCCVECGHLWSQVPAHKLLKILAKYGNKKTREHFSKLRDAPATATVPPSEPDPEPHRDIYSMPLRLVTRRAG